MIIFSILIALTTILSLLYVADEALTGQKYKLLN